MSFTNRYTPLFEVGFNDPTAYLCKQHSELFLFGSECESCVVDGYKLNQKNDVILDSIKRNLGVPFVLASSEDNCD